MPEGTQTRLCKNLIPIPPITNLTSSAEIQTINHEGLHLAGFSEQHQPPNGRNMCSSTRPVSCIPCDFRHLVSFAIQRSTRPGRAKNKRGQGMSQENIELNIIGVLPPEELFPLGSQALNLGSWFIFYHPLPVLFIDFNPVGISSPVTSCKMVEEPFSNQSQAR